MKILITGITGLLGKELAMALANKHEVCGIARGGSFMDFEVHNLDLSDQLATYQTITKINPDIVIHCAAMSNVDQCEKEPDSAIQYNAIATRNVALACQRFDAEMLYISTDYVFNGNDTNRKNGFIETDPLNPASIYGRSKADGEQFVRNLLNKAYIVRVSWLFGKWRENFVSQTVKLLQEGKAPTMVSDMISAPTYVKDLSKAIETLIDSHAYGTYHVTNTGFASRYEIAREICTIIGVPVSAVKQVTRAELHLLAPRPSFSGLANTYWRLSGFKPLRPWQEAIRDFIQINPLP
jgi:dTDP-4-dehydrorhamnose reductase